MARCLDASGVGASDPVNLAACVEEEDGSPKKSQTWDFHEATGQLKSIATDLCLDVVTKPPHDKRPAVLTECKVGSQYQKFSMTPLSMLTCTQKWCAKK